MHDFPTKQLRRSRVEIWVLPLAVTIVAWFAISAFASAATGGAPPGSFGGPSGTLSPPPPTTAKNVTVGKDPHAVTEDLSNGQIFVPNEGSSSVSVISGSSVVKTIAVGKDPATVTYDPSSTLLYVANLGSGNISVINGTTHKVVATVTGLSSSSGGAGFYDPADGAVYILNGYDSTGLSLLSRLPTTFPGSMTTLTLGMGTVFVTYDPATKDMVGSNSGSANLSIVSTTNTVKTVGLTVGKDPDQAIYNPKNKDLYVVDEGAAFPFLKTGNVTVLGSANTVVKTLTVGSHPVTATLDPKNNDLYVVNESYRGGARETNSTLTPITSGNSVKSAIKVGQGAYYATYDPKNFDLYVPEAFSNVTAIISGSTNSILTTLTTTGTPEIGFYDTVSTDVLLLLETTSSVPGRLTILSSPTVGNPVIVGTQVLGKGPSGIAIDTTTSETYVSNADSKSVTIF
ncbi:MAG: YncE family protein [Thermoplasmata archaeon]|nr:YncE family protein [Thermoplasmata archaeon]